MCNQRNLLTVRYYASWKVHRDNPTPLARERMKYDSWALGEHWKTCPECSAIQHAEASGPPNNNTPPIDYPYEFVSDWEGW